jgi:hypothetical protein
VVAVRRRLLPLIAAIVLAGCSGSSNDITFTLEPVPTQPWTATGDLVDDGALCPDGRRRLVGMLDRSGDPLDPVVFFERLFEAADASMSGEPVDPDILSEMEWTCADGSGSFTLREAFGEGEWTVVGGTGAYTAMTGSGMGAWELDPNDGSLMGITMTGTLGFGG